MTGAASPPPTPLTNRQRSVLAFLRERLREPSPPPTNAEIADACGLGAPSGAHRIVTLLQERGYVERAPGKSRALSLSAAPLGPHPPGSAARLVLDAVHAFQAAARDRVIRTAAESDLSVEKKAELLRDAANRNDFIRRYRPSGTPAGDQSADSFGQLLTVLGQQASWGEFVVDHAIFNQGSILGAEPLLQTIPELEPVLLEVIEMSRSSLQQCRIWLSEIIESGEHDNRELQQRAVLMQQVSRVSAGIIAEQLANGHSIGASWSDDLLDQIISGDASRRA